jgi:hypothetical protein
VLPLRPPRFGFFGVDVPDIMLSYKHNV